MNTEELDQDDYETKFSNFFEFKEVLGKGAFGTVISAVSKADKKEYAVKVIRKQGFSPTKWERLRQEALILSELNHPGVIKFKDTIETEKRIFLVMELVKGGQLKHLMDARKKSNQKFSDEEASTIMRSIFKAVQYLHAKEVVHRDLKPENILIQDWNDLRSIKIADFGLSAHFSEDIGFKTLVNQCGTMIFMAPEQVSEKIYSKPVDIWSCGIIMYMILAGRHPLYDKKDSTSSYAKKVKKPKWNFEDFFTPLAQNFFLRLMSPDPVTRYTADDALKHPWITRRFDDEIPLSGHGLVTNFSLAQTFARIIKAVYLVNSVGSFAGSKNSFEAYKHTVQKESKDVNVNKKVTNSSNMYEQYGSLQNLLGITTPKKTDFEGRKGESGGTFESPSPKKKTSLEEIKARDNDGNESDADLTVYGDRKDEDDKSSFEETQETLYIKTEQPETSKKSLLSRNLDQFNEKREDKKGCRTMDDVGENMHTAPPSLALTTEYNTKEFMDGMKNYLTVNFSKTTREPNGATAISAGHNFKHSFDDREPKRNNNLHVLKIKSDVDPKVRGTSAHNNLRIEHSNNTSCASDDSDASVDSQKSANPKLEMPKTPKKSPFFQNHQQKSSGSLLNGVVPPAEKTLQREKSPVSINAIIQGARPKTKESFLPQIVLNTPKSNQSSKNVDDVMGTMRSPVEKTKIRFTSQTPSSHNKNRILFENSEPKGFAKTLGSANKLTKSPFPDALGLGSLTTLGKRWK